MRKCKEILGLPVITLDEGEKVAEVKDLLFDFDQGNLVGVVVEGFGWFKTSKIIPFAKIFSFGVDAVTINSPEVFVDKEEFFWQDGYATQVGSQFFGKRVLTESGNRIGVVEDLLIDPEQGRLCGYEISDGLIQDVLEGRVFVETEDILKPGKDAIIVFDGVDNSH